jgi:hypothetical protein
MEEKVCDVFCHLDKDYYRLVDHLSKLPHKILQYHHLDTLPQILLHELGHETGFGLKKAVYLVDNPDFDHLVGAAGFCCDECKNHDSDLWNNPNSFSDDMKNTCFHVEVRKIVRQSLKLHNQSFDAAIKDVKDLSCGVGMENPQVFSWDMKHGNHGILIFEEEEDLSEAKRNLLNNSVALLSLCGV